MIATHSATLLVALFLATALFGPREWWLRLGLNQPGKRIHHVLKALERKLNRDQRTEDERGRRGLWLTLAWVLLAALVGVAGMALSRAFPWGGLAEALLLACVLPVRVVADRTAYAAECLAKNDIGPLREVLIDQGWRNAAVLDAHGLARASIESAVIAWAERVVGPACWYMLLGLPGAYAAAGLSWLHAVVAPAGSFGYAARQASRAVHLLPALLASLLWAIASAAAPGGRPLDALKAWFAALPALDGYASLVATGGASLGVALGGPGSPYAPGAWLGGEVARATPEHVKQAVPLWWTNVLLFALLFGMLFLRSG